MKSSCLIQNDFIIFKYQKNKMTEENQPEKIQLQEEKYTEVSHGIPTTIVTTPEVKRKYNLKTDRKAFFYPKHFQKILDLCSEKQKYTLLLLINTGARINEARHVEKQDIDNERRNLILRITKVRAKLKETRPSPRIIPLSTSFHKYLKKNVETFKVLSTDATGEFLKNKAKEVGVPNWKDISAHNLRKTFGTWMLALNIDGFKLAQHLGHSPEMLRTSYASPDIFNADDKEIMREILGDLPSRLRGE